MNGVHCQTSAMITEVSGNRLTQSMPSPGSSQLMMPNTGSSIAIHINAPATGVTKNGVINSVRTTPRPTTPRSSNSASSSPNTTEISTVTTIRNTVLKATCQNVPSLTTSR